MRIRHRRSRPRRFTNFQRDLQKAQQELAVARSAYSRDVVDVPVIYHYTDPKGLIGIISSGQLWATDIQYLNDSSELKHARDLQSRLLNGIAQENEAGSIEERLAAAALKPPYSSGAAATYVVCFCAEDDLLTQWKAYGAWGSGFSIGFDRKRLEAKIARLGPPQPSLWNPLILGRVETTLVRVQYSEEEQWRELNAVFTRYRDILSSEASRQSGQSQISAEGSEIGLQDETSICAAAIAANASSSAGHFKHPAFQSEKEWRIVISSSVFYHPQLFFRSSGRTVIPYLQTTALQDAKLPIVSVTIGPTLDQDLSERSVFELLKTRGYFEPGTSVQVKKSEIPLVRTD